jgi:hypothetical protein
MPTACRIRLVHTGKYENQPTLWRRDSYRQKPFVFSREPAIARPNLLDSPSLALQVVAL